MNCKLANEELEVGLASFGGTLCSLRDRQTGIEYLWQGDAKYWSGQAPILFPICGSLRDDKAVTKDGHTLAMPRHGIIRKREFTLEKTSDSEVSYKIESNPETLQMFPYSFLVRSIYSLEGRTLRVTYQAENTGRVAMPFFFGGHPGFRCPLEPEKEDYTDYKIEFEKEEELSVPRPVTETGLIDMEHRTPFLRGRTIDLKHELFEKDAVILDSLKSRKLKLFSKVTGKGLEMEFDDFPYLILWSTADAASFIALEPWTGLSTCSDESNIFEEKRNVLFVGPGERKEYSFTIHII